MTMTSSEIVKKIRAGEAADAVSQAIATGGSRSEVQNVERALTAPAQPAELKKALASVEAARRAQEKAEAELQSAIGLANLHADMQRQVATLERKISDAAGQQGAVKEFLDAKHQIVDSGIFGTSVSVPGVLEQVSGILAAEAAGPMLGQFIERKKAELAQARQALVEFEKEHRIG
jgi:hypothetical protein